MKIERRGFEFFYVNVIREFLRRSIPKPDVFNADRGAAWEKQQKHHE
jgi:hypothetical protein